MALRLCPAPLAVVAATDLLLMAVFGSPWVTGWALPAQYVPSLAGRHAVATLLFPGWGAGDDWPLALWMERWRAGAFMRIVVFLPLHLWVVDQLVRRAGPEGAWRAARTGAWVLGPAVGALAGLATLAPAAFDPSITVEGREALRTAGVLSLRDGAYWGLFAGAVCWIALTSARVVSGRADGRDSGIDADETFTYRQLRGLLVRVLRDATPGLVTAWILLAVLGGPLLAPDPASDLVARADSPAWTDVVRYVHWWTPVGGDVISAYSYVPMVATPVYLYALLVFLPYSAVRVRGAASALGGLASGWHAVTWAVVCYALVTALFTTVLGLVATPVAYGGRWTLVYRGILERLLTDLPDVAAYTAVLGWVPALAIVVGVRIPGLRRLRPDQ